MIAIGLVILFVFTLRYWAQLWKSIRSGDQTTIAFFHPYCDNGGGGERVLWVAIAALLNSMENLNVVIYSGNDGRSKEQILENVQAKFGISVSVEKAKNLTIVFIATRTLLSAEHYPVATMLGQSLGAIVVTFDCLLRYCPDIYCDTTGAAFGYPVAKMFGCSVVTYTHYPHISTDMLQRVREQRPSYNNNSAISTSVAVSRVKLLYYQIFAVAYGAVGRCADTAMVNSSWTRGHIQELWGFGPGTKRTLRLVYPPCNTEALQSIALSRPLLYQESNQSSSLPQILSHCLGTVVGISIGQFRPEKDHFLQLRVMEELAHSPAYEETVLLMVGSVRNREDEMLVKSLNEYIVSKNLENRVFIVTNISHAQLQSLLSVAVFGLHTMWNEHFGISIVEQMAAGVITIAHNSGGPASDIISPRLTGFLATSPKEYAAAIREIVALAPTERLIIQEAARRSSNRFSDRQFSKDFSETIQVFTRR